MKEIVNNKNNQLLAYVAIIFILLTLSLINIKNITDSHKTNIKVLGIETINNPEDKFWKDFLKENPNYLPGLIETGNLDKAKQIDPNFNGLKNIN